MKPSTRASRIIRQRWLGARLPNGYRWEPGHQGSKSWPLVDDRGRSIATLQVADWEPRIGITGLPTRNQPEQPGGSAWKIVVHLRSQMESSHHCVVDAVQHAARIAAWWSDGGAFPARSSETPRRQIMPFAPIALTPGGREWLKTHRWLGVRLPNGHRWVETTTGSRRMVDQHGNPIIAISTTDGHEWLVYTIRDTGGRRTRHAQLKEAVSCAAALAARMNGNGLD